MRVAFVVHSAFCDTLITVDVKAQLIEKTYRSRAPSMSLCFAGGAPPPMSERPRLGRTRETTANKHQSTRTLGKNESDPLWYRRIGLGMTRRVVNVQHILRHKVNKLALLSWFMKHLSNTVKNSVYIGSGRNGK